MLLRILKDNMLESILNSVTSSMIILIDGRCLSGKTVLAAQLADKLDCNVIHMDDFYLPISKRSENWKNEIAGNIDQERFTKQIIQPLMNQQDYNYQSFSCTSQQLNDPIDISYKPITIIEGSYSFYLFRDEKVGLKILLDVDKDKQIERILTRNPHSLESFQKIWIPLEENYYQNFAMQYDQYYDTTKLF